MHFWESSDTQKNDYVIFKDNTKYGMEMSTMLEIAIPEMECTQFHAYIRYHFNTLTTSICPVSLPGRY